MVRTDGPAPTAWVGIDVSQQTLDACLLPAPGGKSRTASFDNTSDGHAALAAWTDQHAGNATLGFCLESTGAYGEALATALADAGRHVAVVNPARVKYAGLMRGQGHKTDRADARASSPSMPPASGPPPGHRPAPKSGNCRRYPAAATTSARSPPARRPAAPPPA